MGEQSSQFSSSTSINGWGPLRTRGYRHNQEQKHFLVSFMEAHPDFAVGRYPGPRQEFQALWVQLTEEINARGPKKTVAQWQKAWTDVKSRARVRVFTKSKYPNFDPTTDTDARVLALLDLVNDNSNTPTSANSTDYEACNLDINELDGQTNPSDFLDSLEAEVLPTKMVLLSETETRPESALSCSISEMKLVLAPDKHLESGSEPLDDEYLEDHDHTIRPTYDSDDIRQNFDQHAEGDDITDSGPGYDIISSRNPIDSRHSRHQRNHARTRWRSLPNRNSSARPSTSSPSSDFHRRQTETLEAISRALLQNAENERERIGLMSQSLQVNKARLKADIERNNLLRDLVSTVKGLSQDKNLRLR